MQDYSAGSQDYSAGSQDYSAGSQDYSAGSQNYGAGSQDYSAGSQDYSAGSQDYIVGLQDGAARSEYGLVELVGGADEERVTLKALANFSPGFALKPWVKVSQFSKTQL
jgi:hypothetical protein